LIAVPDQTVDRIWPTIRYIKPPAGVVSMIHDMLIPRGWLHLQNTRAIKSVLLKIEFCQKSLISNGRTIKIIIKSLYIVMILIVINPRLDDQMFTTWATEVLIRVLQLLNIAGLIYNNKKKSIQMCKLEQDIDYGL
jgi:hypothetical protein